MLVARNSTDTECEQARGTYWAPEGTAGVIPQMGNRETEWNKLKHGVSGNKAPGLTDVEKLLSKNDSE